MNGKESHRWLQWARELQTIAQAGLTYSKSQFEIEHCKRILGIVAEMVASQSETSALEVERILKLEEGYATPKIDVRGAVFQDGKILLVREIADEGRWTLPGGWADIGFTPSENAEREVFEESGLEVKTKKLAGLFDRRKHVQDNTIWHIYKMFFICEVVGGELAPSIETSEARWFLESELPDESEISRGRSRKYHIERMFEHYRIPELPTDFD